MALTFQVEHRRAVVRTCLAHFIMQGDIRGDHASTNAGIELGSGENNRDLRRLEAGQVGSRGLRRRIERLRPAPAGAPRSPRPPRPSLPPIPGTGFPDMKIAPFTPGPFAP